MSVGWNQFLYLVGRAGRCRHCQGTKTVTIPVDADGERIETTCPTCKGTGTNEAERERCAGYDRAGL